MSEPERAKDGGHVAVPGTPKVSVVIPCYNAEAWITETIRSVLTQTYPPVEILVINDGSTDRSAELAEVFGAPVRVINQRNQGESVARNRGFAEAQGDWVALLDADDVWEPDKLLRQVELIEPSVVCVHTDFYFFGAEDSRSNWSAYTPEQRYSKYSLATATPFHMNSSSVLIRRDVATRFVIWTNWGEDLLFFLDLSFEGEFRLAAVSLTGNRRHAGNQSRNPYIMARYLKTIDQWIATNPELVVASDRARIYEYWTQRALKGLPVSQLLNPVFITRLISALGWKPRLVARLVFRACGNAFRFCFGVYSSLRMVIGRWRRQVWNTIVRGSGVR